MDLLLLWHKGREHVVIVSVGLVGILFVGSFSICQASLDWVLSLTSG